MGKRPRGIGKAGASKKPKPDGSETSTSSVPAGFAAVAVPAPTSNGDESTDEAKDDALTLEDLASLKSQAQTIIEELFVAVGSPAALVEGLDVDIPAAEDRLAGLLRGICHEAHRRMTVEAAEGDSSERSTERGQTREYLAWAALELGLLVCTGPQSKPNLRKEGEPDSLASWLSIAVAAAEEAAEVGPPCLEQRSTVQWATKLFDAVETDGRRRFAWPVGRGRDKPASDWDVSLAQDLLEAPRPVAVLFIRAISLGIDKINAGDPLALPRDDVTDRFVAQLKILRDAIAGDKSAHEQPLLARAVEWHLDAVSGSLDLATGVRWVDTLPLHARDATVDGDPDLQRQEADGKGQNRNTPEVDDALARKTLAKPHPELDPRMGGFDHVGIHFFRRGVSNGTTCGRTLLTHDAAIASFDMCLRDAQAPISEPRSDEQDEVVAELKAKVCEPCLPRLRTLTGKIRQLGEALLYLASLVEGGWPVGWDGPGSDALYERAANECGIELD